MARKTKSAGSGKTPQDAIRDLFHDPRSLRIGEISEAYQSPHIRPLFQAAGSVGGKVRAERMLPEERKASAARALQARWARWRRDNGRPPKPGDQEFLEK